MKLNNKVFVCVILLLATFQCIAQPDTLAVNKKKRNYLIIGSSSAYTISLVGLNEIWYKDFEREKFHFFDDSKEWKQMDKLGHSYSAYHISNTIHHALASTGISSKKSYLWGGIVGFLAMAPIEVMDGYSSAYGASASDLVFNFGGALLFTTQGLIWNEQRIYMKYSFQRSGLAPLRPNVLGSALAEEIVKDYNAHTHWLSVDLYKFMNSNSNFPKWINLGLGYGAHNMLYAHDHTNIANGYTPYRQYYLGIDIDLTHIPTKSKWLKGALYIINMIHLPAPALEINEGGNTKFHLFYF